MRFEQVFMASILAGADALDRSGIRILTCDSPCGGGKTHAMTHYAIHAAGQAGQKFVVAQPTIALLDQTAALLRSVDPTIPVSVIHSDAAERPIPEIMEHFRTAMPGRGEVLLVTHAALLRLPHIRNQANWHLVLDEAPQAFWCANPIRLAAHKHLLLDHVDAEPFTAGYVRLLPSHAIDEMALNRSGDMARGVTQTALAHVNSPHWIVVADEENFARFQANAETEPGKVAGLHLYGLLQPSIMDGWKSATLMAANLTHTVAYRYWLSWGVRFTPHTHIKPRYRVHPNGEQLTIYYATERNWSKGLRDKTVDDPERGGVPLLDNIVARVNALHDGRPFAWQANKDVGDDLFDPMRAIRLPHVSHGLNSFQHFDHAVVLGAMNPTPTQFRVLHDLTQINGEEAADAIYREAAYQTACRCSIRDLSRRAARTMVVADRAAAAFLAERFPGAAVLPLPGVDPAPADRRRTAQRRIHKDEASRVAAYRNEVIKALIDEVYSANGISVRPLSYSLKEKARTEDPNTPLSCISSPSFTRADCQAEPDFYGSIFASKWCAEAEAQLTAASDDDWVAFLRRAHAASVPTKDANALLSSAHFDPDATAGTDDPTKRGLANISRCRGIYLDNDGGDLTHEQFAACFPRLRMVIFNSFSSTQDAVRWRCWIPTNRWITPAVHKHLVSMIVERLRKRGYYGDLYIGKRLSRRLQAHGRRVVKAKQFLMNAIRARSFVMTDDFRAALAADGYTGDPSLLETICVELMKVRRHGFDESKYNAAALYYAPCQAAAGPDASFFVDHAGGGRRPIEPLTWIEHSTLDQRPEPPPPAFTERTPAISVNVHERVQEGPQRRRADAIADWRGAAQHSGNSEFNRLGWRLAATGMDEADLRATLAAEASCARSPTERRAQIRDIMRGLRKRAPAPQPSAAR